MSELSESRNCIATEMKTFPDAAAGAFLPGTGETGRPRMLPRGDRIGEGYEKESKRGEKTMRDREEYTHRETETNKKSQKQTKRDTDRESEVQIRQREIRGQRRERRESSVTFLASSSCCASCSRIRSAT